MVLLSEESSDVEPLVAPVRKQPDVPGSANPSPSRMSSDKRLSGGMSSGNIPSQTNFGGDSSALGLTMKVTNSFQ
jgi:hypothetical protein